MEIKIFELSPFATNCYLLLDNQRKEACVFDAPLGAWAAIKPELSKSGCKLKALLLTHGHLDHIGDCAPFSKNGAPTYAHVDDRFLLDRLPELVIDELPEFEPVKVDHFLKDSQTITLLGQPVKVLHVPGHSPGSIVFYFEEEKFAIVGDTLFNKGVGRADFAYGNHDQLVQAIRKKLLTLPGETVIYPGHGPSTTVEREHKTNPYLA